MFLMVIFMEHGHLLNYNTQLVKVIKLKWLKDINSQNNIMSLINMSNQYQNKRIKCTFASLA